MYLDQLLGKKRRDYRCSHQGKCIRLCGFEPVIQNLLKRRPHHWILSLDWIVHESRETTRQVTCHQNEDFLAWLLSRLLIIIMLGNLGGTYVAVGIHSTGSFTGINAVLVHASLMASAFAIVWKQDNIMQHLINLSKTLVLKRTSYVYCETYKVESTKGCEGSPKRQAVQIKPAIVCLSLKWTRRVSVK